jgi:hypothetical protein
MNTQTHLYYLGIEYHADSSNEYCFHLNSIYIQVFGITLEQVPCMNIMLYVHVRVRVPID